MYNTVVHSNKFDLDSAEQRREYDAILNNPLCTVVESRIEKLTEREFGEEGQTMSNDRLIRIITWKQKELL